MSIWHMDASIIQRINIDESIVYYRHIHSKVVYIVIVELYVLVLLN